MGVAYYGTAALVRSLSAMAPVELIYSAGPDARVLIVTLAFCTLSTLLFGLGPAWSLIEAGHGARAERELARIRMGADSGACFRSAICWW